MLRETGSFLEIIVHSPQNKVKPLYSDTNETHLPIIVHIFYYVFFFFIIIFFLQLLHQNQQSLLCGAHKGKMKNDSNSVHLMLCSFALYVEDVAVQNIATSIYNS